MLVSVLLFIGTSEAIVIVAVILLFFGGKKVPEIMKGLGRGVKEFNDAKNSICNPLEEVDSKHQEETTKKE